MASGTWTAIVVDPLRSLAKQEPELAAFRVYPPRYSLPPSDRDLCPDGSIDPDAQSRTTRWGLSYQRYYQLRTSYFMSGLGAQMLEVMSKSALWARMLSSAPVNEPENRARLADRIKKAAERLHSVDANALVLGAPHAASGPPSAVSMLGLGPMGHTRSGRKRREVAAGVSDELTKGAQACCEIAIEQVRRETKRSR